MPARENSGKLRLPLATVMFAPCLPC